MASFTKFLTGVLVICTVEALPAIGQAAAVPDMANAIANSTATLSVANIEAYESLLGCDVSISENIKTVHILDTDEFCSNDRSQSKQYCVQITGDPYTYVDLVGAPVTACLDSRYGEGGSTSKQLTIGVTVTPGFSTVLSDTAISAVALTAGITVSQSVSFSLSDSCDVTTGNIVQMWGYPFYTVTKLKHRSFKYSKVRGKKVSKSEWSPEKEVTFASGISPATRCIGSVDESICGQTRVQTQFTVPGEPLVE